MNSLLALQEIHLKSPSNQRPILEKISLCIHPRDFIILLGSNGSGKSSLIKTINGLSPPTSGGIFLNGQNISNKTIHQRAQSIVTLTQDLNLSTFSQLTVLENCLIAFQRNQKTSFAISVKQQRMQIYRYLYDYNPQLAKELDKPVQFLSGGERQTLALAMSLYHKPALLLLDEHTSALDPAMAKKVMELTFRITQEFSIPTMMTTHNLHDALSYGNRLIVMHQGQIIHDFNQSEKAGLSMKDLLALFQL